MKFSHIATEQDIIDLNFLLTKRLGKWNFKKLFYFELVSLFIVILGIYMVKFECFCFDYALTYFGITIPAIILVSFSIASYQRHCAKKQLIKYSKSSYKDSLDYIDATHEIKEDFLYTTTKNSSLNTYYKNIKNIIKSEERFFIILGDFRSFVFVINEPSEEFIRQICKKTGKEVECLNINGYKNRIWG